MFLKYFFILTMPFLFYSCEIDFHLAPLYYQSNQNSKNYLYDYTYTGFTDSYHTGLLVFDSTIVINVDKIRAHEYKKIHHGILYRPNKEQTIQILNIKDSNIKECSIYSTQLKITPIPNFNASIVSGKFDSNQSSVFYDFEQVEETEDALVFLNVSHSNLYFDTLYIKKGPIQMEEANCNIAEFIVDIPATENFESGVYQRYRLIFRPKSIIPAKKISPDGVFKLIDTNSNTN